MKKAYWPVILVLVLVVAAVVIWRFKPQSSEGVKVRVGAILPLTGSASLLGKGVQEGIQIAAAELNAAGGVNGEEIQVFFEDSKNEAKEGVAAFQKLMAVNHPTAIICEMSSVSKALAPLAAREQIVAVATVTASPDLTDMSDWVFRNYYSTRTQGDAIAEYTSQKLGLKRVGILYLTDDYGVTGEKEFRSALAQRGISDIASEGYPKDATDLRAQATKLIDKATDGICVIAYDEALARAFTQIRELGYKGHLLTYTGLANPTVLEHAGAAAEGAYVSMADFDPASPQGNVQKRFVSDYKAKYGKLPSHYEAFGYDTLQCIVQALKQAQPSSPQAIREKLANLPPFEGVMGKISISARREVEFPQTVKVVKNGQIVTIQ